MTYKIEEAGSQWIFHWVALMLGALKNIDISNKIDVCFDNEEFLPYQKESFEILFDVLNVVPKTDSYELILSIKPLDFTNNSGLPLLEEGVYQFLRDLFNSRIQDDFDTSGFEKIYVCRSKAHLLAGNVQDGNARRRQIINEDEIVESLKKIGIRSIFFEEYTMRQKIQIVRNAKQIVSPQSGGLTFTIWANQNADIVEIYPPNPHQYCDQYIDICRTLGIPFRRFTDVVKMDKYDNMVVDPEKLVEYILNK
jgi:hypothetical protein